MAGRASTGGTGRPLRFAFFGLVGGFLVFAVVMIIRSRENDTLILEVGPAHDPGQVRVYVGGAVVNPGLYSLARGERVSDAIDAAGGLAPGADVSELGMAALLEDSDQIIVAIPAAPADEEATSAAQGSPPNTPSALLSGGSGLMNVNSAGAAELETLPGIGPVLAVRIVEYRMEHGPFQTIDELEAVRGISQAMVEDLRPLVAIGP